MLPTGAALQERIRCKKLFVYFFHIVMYTHAYVLKVCELACLQITQRSVMNLK